MRVLWIVLGMGLAAACAVPAEANELLRVYQLALESDATVLAAAKARDAALEAEPQARGALLPQVSAGGEVSTERSKTTTLFNVSNCGSPTCTETAEPYALSLNLNQVIYNKSLFERLKQADHRVAAAEAAYRVVQQGLALRLSEYYFVLLGAADNLRFANAENKAIERQLEQARQRFEVGLSAITDVQEAQARYDLTVAQQIEADQGLASAREALAEITGSSETRIAVLIEEIPLAGPDPADVQAWLRAAADGNLGLIAARIQTEIAARDIKINAAGHHPTLSLNGAKAVGEQGGAFNSEFDQERITLQLNVPIYSGGVTSAAVTAAERTHEQRLAELEGARRAAERGTRNAYQGVVAGVSRVKALKQAVVSNTTALEASEVGLQVGTRTAVDVLNAQRELYRAQRDHSRARYDYLLSVLRLKLAAGRLGEKDLGEIDRLLSQAPELELAN